MKTEIKIILEEGASNKKQGGCFENLIRNILSTHQYEIRSNINFSGMEIDLIADHKHKNEKLYVECKAKEKVSSDELTKFAFNVMHKKADAGYFFRTKELESQAGALLAELKEDERYQNLTFFEPNQIIQILIDGKFVTEPTYLIKDLNISKRILAITYFGDFLIYTINKSQILPTNVLIVNAENAALPVTISDIGMLKERIEEISDLTLMIATDEDKNKDIESRLATEIETISEVQSSENWFDYLPASTKDFIGREKIRGLLFDFFKDVLENNTSKRIFYLTGKSGWGKSSLVSEIRGRCRNRHYKKRFYTVAIDTRSATSGNFVALAFEKLFHSAITNGFIKSNFSDQNLKFTSNVDLLSSDSVQNIFLQLKKQRKVLILIFDQFEDVFRKENLFKTFYKFLSDVTDAMPNLVIGFSWKTEIVIPIDHEAYSYWQQSKDQAKEFNIKEFSEKEIDGVIKQLETSVGKLNQDIKRRIKESSQGLPWLTKKLCIHIYEQIKSGARKEKLIDANLNIQELFEKEKEKIGGDELSALRFIAKKAYDGNFFDISEIGEQISNSTIDSLRDKRLIIRSGANYNIYWDIFRDYLVTNDVPPIGESYILRQGVNPCMDLFLLFAENNVMNRDLLLKNYSKNIGVATLDNVLLELRNVGLIQRIADTDDYTVAVKNIPITKEGFIVYITSKFANYTPLMKLSKLGLKNISKEDIVSVFKDTFKYEFQDNTWNIYATTLIGWLLKSNVPIREKIVEPQKGRRIGYTGQGKITSSDFLLRTSVKELVNELKSHQGITKTIKKSYVRDLFLLEIISEDGAFTDFGKSLVNDIDKGLSELVAKVRQLPKMVALAEFLASSPGAKPKELVAKMPMNFFDGNKPSSKILYASKLLTWLK